MSTSIEIKSAADDDNESDFWIDFCTPGSINDHRGFCHRLFCWPCQCSQACRGACLDSDCGGVFRVVCCCPCRTCCSWCPTKKEAPAEAEPDEIPYTLVFEMERKKRDMLKQAQIE